MKGFGKQITAGLTVALFITTATCFVIYTAGVAYDDQNSVTTANINGSSSTSVPTPVLTGTPWPTVTPAPYVVTVYAVGGGTGNVKSSDGGIDLVYPTTPLASEQLNYGSSVTITATGTNGSTAAWSGDCDSKGGTSLVATCTISGIWISKYVTATFTTPVTTLPVRIGNTGYQDLQTAYGQATDMSVIEMLAGNLSGSLTGALYTNNPVNVKIKGGFDTTYTTNSGITVINGKFTLWKGSITVERVKIK